MTEKKKTTDTEPRRPVKTFRQGAIGASVWLKQSNTGLVYYDFTLSRSWKSLGSGKEGYSSNFFEQNCDELKEVVEECCDYIAELGRQGLSDFQSERAVEAA